MPEGLEQLRPIHWPAPITWWPPAPGYIVLMIGAVLASIIGLFLYRTRHARRMRRQALMELTALKNKHAEHLNVSITAALISQLLKQVALIYYPRAQVAALQGEAWLVFLKTTSKKLPLESVRTTLLEAPFCVTYHATIDPLFTVAKRWIKQRSRLWLN